MSASRWSAMASATVMSVVVGVVLLCVMVSGNPTPPEASDPIMCVQCTPSDPRCESGNNIEPRECEPTHRYCAQIRVFIQNSQGTYRGCSRRWKQGCQRTTIEEPGDSLACYNTCSWDGCNGGGMTSSLLH